MVEKLASVQAQRSETSSARSRLPSINAAVDKSPGSPRSTVTDADILQRLPPWASCSAYLLEKQRISRGGTLPPPASTDRSAVAPGGTVATAERLAAFNEALLNARGRGSGQAALDALKTYADCIPCLVTLDLTGVKFNRPGAVATLANLLKPATSIRELSMQDCGVRARDAATVAGMLAGMPSLESLDMSHNGFNDKGTPHLADVSVAGRLRKLDLSYNHIGDTSAIALIEAISPKVETLRLEGNSIARAGAVAIAERLPKLGHLMVLSLANNHLNDKGTKALHEALLSAPKLRDLDLSCNGITTQGALNLARILPLFANLEALNLNSQPLGDAGVEALVTAAGRAKNLRTVNLVFCGLSQASYPGLQAQANSLPNAYVLLVKAS